MFFFALWWCIIVWASCPLMSAKALVKWLDLLHLWHDSIVPPSYLGTSISSTPHSMYNMKHTLLRESKSRVTSTDAPKLIASKSTYTISIISFKCSAWIIVFKVQFCSQLWVIFSLSQLACMYSRVRLWQSNLCDLTKISSIKPTTFPYNYYTQQSQSIPCSSFYSW